MHAGSEASVIQLFCNIIIKGGWLTFHYILINLRGFFSHCHSVTGDNLYYIFFNLIPDPETPWLRPCILDDDHCVVESACVNKFC